MAGATTVASFLDKVPDGLLHDLTIDVRDGVRQRDVLRTDSNTVRTDLHTKTARHAPGHGIRLLLFFGRYSWTWSQIVRSIDRDPCFDALEILE